MSIWRKLFTGARGAINEAAEAVADSQSLRILDQEIRDSEAALRKARDDLAALMGKERISRDRLHEMKAKYDRDIGMLEKLVAQGGDEALQNELAERIAAIEAEAKAEAETCASYTNTRVALEQTVRQLTAKIEQVKREVDKVKVTASVQEAQKAIMAHGAGINSTVGGAAATLAKIKEKQAGLAATYEARQMIEDSSNGSDLDRKLAAAGVGDGPGSAASVLARARAKALGKPQETLAIGHASE